MDALTVEYFRNLKQGEIVILHYNLYNKGTFVWVHDHVGPNSEHWAPDDDRVWGRFIYEGESMDDIEVSDYLYEFEGKVSRGSGAEPVYLEMPEDPEEDEEGVW